MKIARDPVWKTQVGNRIVALRNARGVKQSDLAKSLRISAQRLSNYENGKRPLDIELAILICSKLSGTLDYLYRGVHAGLPFEVIERLAIEEGRFSILGGTDGLKN
jgi:transcriptional regulator with XRE-family HTH domain